METANNIISNALLTINQYKGLPHLKAAVSNDEYNSSVLYFSRTLVWKSVLITDSLKIQQWEVALERSRSLYDELFHLADMSVPWSKLNEDSAYYSRGHTVRLSSRASSSPRASRSGSPARIRSPSPSRKSSVRRKVLTRVPAANPLDSPPPQYSESDVELLESIVLDIDRLFPGEEFFQPSNPKSLAARKQLIEVIYVWGKCHPTVGYKQGVHEIVGLVYMNLHRESIAIRHDITWTNEDLMILNLYDINFLPHDLFALMNQFLVQSGVITSFYESEAVLWKSIEKFNINLMKVDQLIHYNLVSQLKIESQLWIIRYFRLLLLREVASGGNHGNENDLEVALLYWDKLICNPHGLSSIPDLVMFLVIQLLIQLKTELITCDFGEALSLLLHYPIQAKINKNPGKFIASVCKDATKLYEVKNNDLKLYELGIKLNSTYNPNVKIMFTPKALSETSERVEKLKFDKLRLEMRLKKKTREMINK